MVVGRTGRRRRRRGGVPRHDDEPSSRSPTRTRRRRHEERLAYGALVVARADVRAAKGDVLAAKARRDAPVSVLADARRRFGVREGPRVVRVAEPACGRAAGSRRLRCSTSSAPPTPRFPIAALVARQDAVTARWLAYETDPAKALSYPQMLDAQHPATLAFLRAQRDAQELRPSSTSDRVTPETYVAYRDAVGAAETAFEAAERDALGVARESVAGRHWGPVTISDPVVAAARRRPAAAPNRPGRPASGTLGVSRRCPEARVPAHHGRCPRWRAAPPPQR